MPLWAIWIVITVVFLLGELLTLSFFLAPFAAGALAAAATDAFGLGLEIQLPIFIVVSLALLFALRPVARRHRQTPPEIRTNAQALLDTEAVVTETVTRDAGQAKVANEIWSARIEGEGELAAGTRTRVISVDGAIVILAQD